MDNGSSKLPAISTVASTAFTTQGTVICCAPTGTVIFPKSNSPENLQPASVNSIGQSEI